MVGMRPWLAANVRPSAVGRSPHQKRFQTEKADNPEKNDDPWPPSRSHEASILPEGRFCTTKTHSVASMGQILSRCKGQFPPNDVVGCCPRPEGNRYPNPVVTH